MKQTQNARALVWVGGILGALLLILAIVMLVMRTRMGSAPPELDTATTASSENGLFVVSYQPATGSVQVNQMHEWTLHVETGDGQPVEDASITIDGDMPQHGHGLPTRPEVTENLGDGNYRVEGLRFQMAGWWVMDFTITADGQTDTVHFNMMLE